MANHILTPCEYARERHQNMVQWLNLWTILLFAFATALIIFLILVIFLFIRSTWLPVALSTIGSIVSGVIIQWIVKRRTVAKEEEEKAYQDVVEQCQESQSADEVRNSNKILRKIL
jgi:putative flippase GtrA